MLSVIMEMTDVHLPYDCTWKEKHIEIAYVTGVKDRRFTAGVYNLLPTRICKQCGNTRLLGGQCAESQLHRHLKNVDGTYQIGYYYSKTWYDRKKAADDLLTEHIWGAKGRRYFGKRPEEEYLEYCKALAKALFLVAQHNFPSLLKADLIVPVPTHKEDVMRNLKAVGIARELGKVLVSHNYKIPVLECLEKVKNTQTMSLDGLDREEAVEGMFEFRKSESVKGKKVILIDDVLIGGHVKGKCVDLLKENGADKVWIFVAGRNY